MGTKATFIPFPCSAIEWGDLVSILLAWKPCSLLLHSSFGRTGGVIGLLLIENPGLQQHK